MNRRNFLRSDIDNYSEEPKTNDKTYLEGLDFDFDEVNDEVIQEGFFKKKPEKPTHEEKKRSKKLEEIGYDKKNKKLKYKKDDGSEGEVSFSILNSKMRKNKKEAEEAIKDYRKESHFSNRRTTDKYEFNNNGDEIIARTGPFSLDIPNVDFKYINLDEDTFNDLTTKELKAILEHEKEHVRQKDRRKTGKLTVIEKETQNFFNEYIENHRDSFEKLNAHDKLMVEMTADAAAIRQYGLSPLRRGLKKIYKSFLSADRQTKQFKEDMFNIKPGGELARRIDLFIKSDDEKEISDADMKKLFNDIRGSFSRMHKAFLAMIKPMMLIPFTDKKIDRFKKAVLKYKETYKKPYDFINSTLRDEMIKNLHPIERKEGFRYLINSEFSVNLNNFEDNELFESYKASIKRAMDYLNERMKFATAYAKWWKNEGRKFISEQLTTFFDENDIFCEEYILNDIIDEINNDLFVDPYAESDEFDIDDDDFVIQESVSTEEAIVQEGMFDAGFNNLRLKLANALGEKFKVTNVMKGMGGKDKFDITEVDGDGDIKTTVESTGNGCKVVTRGDGKFKCNFNNVPLSAAFNKIVELFKTPELLLENARTEKPRFSRFYQEESEEVEEDVKSDNDENDDPPPELPDDDLDDDNEETTEEVEVDVSTFGTDTSDVQNEYDPKEIDSLNKLIAAESEAINDYFDASKDTNDENLRRLYSDIGHEERFHLEQLMYAKSTLTGERYEPRDPDVKKEYEELLAMGMDEDTAMSTAIDKTNIANSVETKSEEELTEEAAHIYENLFNNQLIMEFALNAIDDKSKRNTIMDANTKFVLEAFYQEEMTNVAQAPKEITSIPNPLKLLSKGFKAAINGLLKMSTIIKDSIAKSNVKRQQRREWLSRHDFADLFRGGVHLYFYDDKNSRYDFNTPSQYVDLLYRLTKTIGESVGIKLTQNAQHKTISNPINFKNIDDGMRILKGVVLNKTKVVVTDKNKQALINEFFGYNDKKINVKISHDGSAPVNDSDNIYNKLNVLIVITNKYANVSNAVLDALEKMQGDVNSIYYKDRQRYNKAVEQIKFVINKFTQYITCMAHDLNKALLIDKEVIEQTRARDLNEQHPEIAKQKQNESNNQEG